MQSIKTDNGTIKLTHSEYNVKIEYRVPDWNDIGETYPCFKYKNEIYFLTEFMPCDIDTPFYPEFDAYCNELYFSGVLIKWNDYETLNVCTYYCEEE